MEINSNLNQTHAGSNAYNSLPDNVKVHDGAPKNIFSRAASIISVVNISNNICKYLSNNLSMGSSVISLVAAASQYAYSQRLLQVHINKRLIANICAIYRDVCRDKSINLNSVTNTNCDLGNYLCGERHRIDGRYNAVMASCFTSGLLAGTVTLLFEIYKNICAQHQSNSDILDKVVISFCMGALISAGCEYLDLSITDPMSA